MSTHFKNGKKITDGRTIEPKFVQEALSSNGMTVYSAVLWADGSTSCNCPAWANRKKCKHSDAAAKLTGNQLLFGAQLNPTLAGPTKLSSEQLRLLDL